MKASQFDESKFLNAKSAGKYNGVTLTIYDAKDAMVGTEDNQKRKMVLEFENVEKTLVVNKTNREILTEAWGDETDDWRGKHVVLHIVSVTFKGERTPSIQLEPRNGSTPPQPAPEQAPIIDAEKAQAPAKKGKGKA